MQKAIRILIGVLSISAIIFVLWQLPYDILREERFRLYGETRTTGLVTEVRTLDEGPFRYVIGYKYIDQDGRARQAEAPLPKDIWEKFRPGNRLEVLYVRSKPNLARIQGEIEPPFQLWLRDLLN